MAHDDTIESLYYAQVHSFPTNMKRDKEKKRWFKPKKKAPSFHPGPFYRHILNII